MARKIAVQWQDSYSVGIKLIDDQHRELVRMTGELAEAVEKGGSEAEVLFMKVIQGAVKYVKTHFTTEEIIMERFKFPEYLAHKKEHEDFVAEVLKDVKSFEEGRKFVPLEFTRFLQNWILGHIAGSDRKYAGYFDELRAKGQLDESMLGVG
jgi:hemerythrin